jgi:peptidase E
LTANPTEMQRTTFIYKKKKEFKALFYIQHNVDINHFDNISKVTISKEARDILEKYHDGSEKVKLQSLGRKFKLMFLEGDQRLDDYFSNLLVVLNQMKACGENVSVQ